VIWIFIMGVIVWWWVAYALALRKERERQKHVDDPAGLACGSCIRCSLWIGWQVSRRSFSTPPGIWETRLIEAAKVAA